MNIVRSTKRFALVGDSKPDTLLGGAALVDAYIVAKLREFGYEIEHYAVNNQTDDWTKFISTPYDGVIYTNLAGMLQNQLSWVVESGPPYVLLRHDIPTVLYNFSNATQELREVVARLFDRARCSIFVSNLQRNVYSHAIELGPSTVIPPPIDFSEFGKQASPPGVGLLYLGPINEIRGLRRSIEYWKTHATDTLFHAYGKIEDVELADYATKIGVTIFPALTRQEVARIMPKYKEMVHHPNFVDSFCIKIIEAELSGLRLAVDRNKIGRFSFDADAGALSRYMEHESCRRISKIIQAFF